MPHSLLPDDIAALAARVVAENAAAGRKVALAESCTGGLVAGAVTEIAGSSAVLDRGFVTYSNEAKMEMLGVASDIIETFGAVSIACAWAMAKGALERSRADVAVAISGVELEHFFLALILLGVGWNFGFIGSTAMLASAHAPEERGRIQGINDFAVFGGVFLASLSSGSLMNCTAATSAQAGWQAVNIAMIPFLVLAGASLIWLMMRPKETR